MKKRFAKIIAIGVLIIMAVGLFTGCESSQERQVREDYVAYINSSSKSKISLDDVEILKNYGTYNGAVVVLIGRMACDALTGIEIDGVDFKFNNCNTPLVWKDSQFFELSGAYNNGTLTKENLIAIAKKVNK